MISSIQLREEVKNQLARHKEKENESFEDVILRLLKEKDLKKNSQKELLIEGYKEMAEENLKISKSFEKIDESFDWEWK